jgi:hypothetical protein
MSNITRLSCISLDIMLSLQPHFFIFSKHWYSFGTLLCISKLLYSPKTAIPSLQIKHKALFTCRNTQHICLSNSPEKFYIQRSLYTFLIMTLYRVFLFNLFQSYFITDNPKQVILDKNTRTLITTFQRMIFLSQKELMQFYPEVTWSKFCCINTANALTSTIVSMTINRYILNCVINISVTWTSQYLKNILQIMFWNNVKHACVLVETLMISVTYSIGEMMSEFPSPNTVEYI